MKKNMIKVLLVEDDRATRVEYRKAFKNHPLLQLVGEVDNSDEAIEILGQHSVDALILDLELSEDSGILLLEKIQEHNISRPFIAVVTQVVSKVVYSAIRKMGVDYIYAKGENYSLDVPLSIVEISAPYQVVKEKPKQIVENLNIRTQYKLYRRNINNELNKMGFNEKMSGTAYLVESILYMIMNDKIMISMTKELYPEMAVRCKSTITSIERNMRIAIEKVWTEQPVDKLKEMYPFEWSGKTGRPTNAEFLYNMRIVMTGDEA